MSPKKLWLLVGGGVIAALAVLYFAHILPPSNGTEGAIGQRQVYRDGNVQASDVNATPGSAPANMATQAAQGSNTQGAVSAGSNVQGAASLSNVQGASFSNVQGASFSNVQGASFSNVQGASFSNVQGSSTKP